MLISIVTTSYNYEGYIVETIESVLNQTYNNWEMIIVDDGSSDDSVKNIKKYCEKDSRIKLFQHEGYINKGIVETLRLGVEKAKGEWIIFLESDDTIEPVYIERKIGILEKHPKINFIFNDVNLIYTSDTAIDKFYENLGMNYFESFYRNLENKVFPADLSNVFLNFNIVPTFSCVMLKKEILKDISFNSPIPQWLDTYLWSQIVGKHKFYYCNEKLTNWRIHSESYNKTNIADEEKLFFYDAIRGNVGKVKKIKLFKACKTFLKNQKNIVKKKICTLKKKIKIKRILKNTSLHRIKHISHSQLVQKKQELISIIVPAYKSEKYIERCIKSIINQSYKNIEIIIVYLNSDDNTMNIIKSFKDNRIKIVEQTEKTGPGGARNMGIDYATGTYIGFVEADDYIPKDFYRLLYSNIYRHDSDMAMCEIIEINKDNASNYITEIDYNQTLFTLREKLKIMNNGAVFNKLFKSSLLKNNDIKFINHYRFEDNPFLLEAVFHSNKITKTNSTVYYYCREDSWSEAYISFLKESIPPIAKIMIDFSLNNNFQKSEKKQVKDIIINSFVRDFIKDKAVKSRLEEIFDDVVIS